MYFSKIIKTGERQREFNFRKLVNSNDNGFHVDVPDDKGNRIMFSMHQSTDGIWKTEPEDLPVWIHDVEPILADAIKEYDYPKSSKKR